MGPRHVVLRRAVGAALAGAALLASADAAAYCRTTTCDPQAKNATCPVDKNGCTRAGAPLSWRSLPIVYRFHANGSQKIDRDGSREAVRAAFQRWTDVSCANGRTSLRFQEEEDIAADMPLAPSAPGAAHFGIYFRDEGFAGKDADSTLALTTQQFGLVNGYVDSADIEINTTTATFATSDAATGIDLQAVLTHEVGHYMGLAHSLDPKSIMVSKYCESSDRCGHVKTESRQLAEDDMTAVCALFPPGGPSGVAYEDPQATSCAAAPAGRSGHGGASGGATWALLGGAALVTAALRRARSLAQ